MVELINRTIIRIHSSLNEWIDCIFLVEEENEEALEILKKAWDAFWEEGEGWCLGNFLEKSLEDAGIAFDVYYADTEE